MRTSFGRYFLIFSQLFPARRKIRQGARRQRSRFQSGLFLEALEDRRLLASDFSITKTGPVGTVAAGSNVTYTIVVSNPGPDAAAPTVTDPVPSASITGATFTSTATGGATGNTSGTGNILNAVTMPAGSTITYVVTGNVAAGATGTLSNNATVAAAPGIDTNLANNTSTANNILG